MTFSSVAILIDGDNVSSGLAGQILRKTKELGPARVLRAYGNNQSLVSWSSAPSFRRIFAGNAKNGADMLLSIEAMQFALRDRIEAFALVTSDRDFSHIAHALKELGHHVEGLGDAKAPNDFRRACSHFTELDPLRANIPDENLSKMDAKIRSSLETAGRKGILVTRLNEIMRGEHGIKISEQPEKKWTPYLRKRPDLYAISGEGKEARVHIATQQ